MPGETASGFLRLFIAIAVPPDVRQEIGRAQAQLRRCSPPGAIRWTKPEQFHVTLKFLGDVHTGQLAALEKSVAAVCAGFPSLELSANGVGFFPGRRRPRVVWAGAVDWEHRLGELHRQIDETTLPFAVADKPGTFTGHITLGRFKPGHRVTPDALLKRAEMLRDRHYGNWSVRDLEIVRCDLTPAGALHTVAATCRLGH